MKDNLKLLLKYIMRFVLRIYWLFPIKQKTVFFMANMGNGFLCNPKYLYLSLIDDKRFSEYKFIWCFINSKGKGITEIDKKTKVISKKSYFSFFYYLLTSEVIIYNCGGFSYAPIRKRQFLIETGHGGGLQKRNGFLVESKSKASKKGIAIASGDIKLWLASDKMHEKLYIRNAMKYKGEILKSGYPRSDILFRHDPLLIKKVRQRLGVREGVHIVLYAPTFRGKEDKASVFSRDAERINVDIVKKKLEERFGGEWIFAKRGHLYAHSIPGVEADYDWTGYDDMQELLLISDILISDYSSSIWDFFLLCRPTFLFVSDRKYYEERDRGFYIPIEQWPGIIVNNNNEWNQAISEFDEKKYWDKLEQYRIFMNPYEKGSACEAVKNRILEETEKAKTF